MSARTRFEEYLKWKQDAGLSADRILQNMSLDLVEFTTTSDLENTTHLPLAPETIERFDAMQALASQMVNAITGNLGRATRLREAIGSAKIECGEVETGCRSGNVIRE